MVFTLAIAIGLIACKNESKDSFQNVEANAAEVPANASPMEQIKAVALEEGDIIGRTKQSFIALQEEYKKASGKVPGIGEVNVFVDDNFTLMIENKADGHVYQTKVNLKDLESEQGGLSLIPDDGQKIKFPGLKLNTKGGKAAVEHLKDGKQVKTENFLEIYLADRPSIEKVTPAILQGINIANDKMPK